MLPHTIRAHKALPHTTPNASLAERVELIAELELAAGHAAIALGEYLLELGELHMERVPAVPGMPRLVQKGDTR